MPSRQVLSNLFIYNKINCLIRYFAPTRQRHNHHHCADFSIWEIIFLFATCLVPYFYFQAIPRDLRALCLVNFFDYRVLAEPEKFSVVLLS